MDEYFEMMRIQRETPLTVEEIAALPDDDLDDRVWARALSCADLDDPESLMALPEGVRAYLLTRLFEWEVGNGGLHQYFFNYSSPELLQLLLDGYSFLGLGEARNVVAGAVAPVAAREQEWRESLRDGTIETFAASYSETELGALDDQIARHDAERMMYVRSNPELFAR